MSVFDFINSDEFDGLVRHILTTVGGMTLVTGNMDPSQWQTIAGAVATLLGVAWSVANKKYMREKVKA
jgi:hypothetical protein